MADVNLAVQKVTKAGLDLTDNGSLSVSDTYLFPNNGKTWLHFKKTGAGAATVTVQTPRTVDGLAVAEHTFNVPATTGDVVVGPLERETFNATDGKARFTLSEITGLTVALATLEG